MAPRAARASMHVHSAESTRAHAVQLLNEKIAALMPFKNKTVRARACCRIRICRDFQKKEKENQHATSQVAFSWSVYFSNRTESYLIFGRSRPWSALTFQIEFAGPHGITENQATYLHCGGEARAKKRARPPATCRKASTGKTGADTGPEGSTKTTIMTVHVNPIMQAAPSQRRIISISEASNQLLFHSQKFFVE